MYFIWGSVPVRVQRLLGFEAETVFDPTGCDYLWTDYTVSLEGMWGRYADGYDMANLTPEGPVPVMLAAALTGIASGVRSVVATRHALAQRSPFVLYEISPRTGLAEIYLASGGIDAANGPTMAEPPAVQSVHGQGGLVFVRCTFKVSVCDCPFPVPGELRGSPTGPLDSLSNGPRVVRRTVGTPIRSGQKAYGDPESDDDRQRRRESEFVGTPAGPPVVGQGLGLLSLNGTPVLRSNRWTTSVGYDPANEAPVYRINGQAIFRRDAFTDVTGVASIDQFRGSIIPVMPFNCVRTINDISVSGDGLTLVYDVSDRVQVRGYLDFRMVSQAGGRARPIGNGIVARNVAGVSLKSRRELIQPSILQAAQPVVQGLANVQWAFGQNVMDKAADAAGAAANPALAAGEVALEVLKKSLKFFTTVSAIADPIMPQTTETATAEVRLTREGTLADGVALGMAMVSGVLDVPGVNRILKGGDPNPVMARFGGLPPASAMSVDIDHKEGVVTVSQTVGQSGLADFLLGGQQAAIAQMFRPPPDEVVGGRNALGILNIATLFKIIGAPILGPVQAIIGDPGFLLTLVDQAFTNKFAEEVIVTDADVILRGPNGDQYSRALCDLLVRSAQVLMRPCETPLAAANQDLETFPPRLVTQGGIANVGGYGPKPGDPRVGAPNGQGNVNPPPVNNGTLTPGQFPSPK